MYISEGCFQNVKKVFFNIMLDRWITYVLLSLTSTGQEANRSWTVLDENTVCPPVRTMDRTLKYRNWVFDPPNSRLHTTNCQKKKIQFSSPQIKLIVRVCVRARIYLFSSRREEGSLKQLSEFDVCWRR